MHNELPGIITRSFGTSTREDIIIRAQRILSADDGYKYRLALNPADLAEVCLALREYAMVCANATGEALNERALSLYVDILSTLRIEEI